MGKGAGKGAKKGTSSWPDGFAGVSSNGLFGTSAAWVDVAKAPGHTSQEKTLGLEKTAKSIATLSHMLWSPNLVWFAMACAYHVFFPYDIEAARRSGFVSSSDGGSWAISGWVLSRFYLNYCVALAYYGYFYAQLYVAGAAARKYQPGVVPTAGNMAHNLWYVLYSRRTSVCGLVLLLTHRSLLYLLLSTRYWSLAIVQWTFWEAAMVRLWASGAIGFATDAQLLGGDLRLLGLNAFWVLFLPVWRDIHFYIAHRFLHIRAVYTYVHKLHHRNADPEPFSGLCMHPVEHLYYFSCAFVPSLYVGGLSPLILIWNW